MSWLLLIVTYHTVESGRCSQETLLKHRQTHDAHRLTHTRRRVETRVFTDWQRFMLISTEGYPGLFLGQNNGGGGGGWEEKRGAER
jgi:hypothetical protein